MDKFTNLTVSIKNVATMTTLTIFLLQYLISRSTGVLVINGNLKFFHFTGISRFNNIMRALEQ